MKKLAVLNPENFNFQPNDLVELCEIGSVFYPPENYIDSNSYGFVIIVDPKTHYVLVQWNVGSGVKEIHPQALKKIHLKENLLRQFICILIETFIC